MFLIPSKKWRFPKKAEILIYDQESLIALEPYLVNYKTTTIAIRGESINIPCLILASLTLSFWQGSGLQVYMNMYIKLVKPQIVITTIDNDWRFYEISKNFSSIVTIFIQNGLRDDIDKVYKSFNKKNSFHVDFMLVTCTPVGKKYLEYISGEIKVIGTLKNNSVKIKNNLKKNTILFISEWAQAPADDKQFLVSNNGKVIKWKDFFLPEDFVLSFLDRWCFENHKVLQICGRESREPQLEATFFAERLKKCAWEYLPYNGIYGAYEYIDFAEVVVSIGSTCGYESLSRGKRTAIFSCRGVTTLSSASNFGWPVVLAETGPFWTNSVHEREFERIMNSLMLLSDQEWNDTISPYLPDVMAYDEGNSTLIDLLAKLVKKPKI